MAVYTYADEFVIGSIDSVELENEEAEAIVEVDKLTIEDELYREKMIIAKVYISLCIKQLDGNGMSDKLNAYKAQYKEYYSLAKSNSQPARSVSSISIARS